MNQSLVCNKPTSKTMNYEGWIKNRRNINILMYVQSATALDMNLVNLWLSVFTLYFKNTIGVNEKNIDFWFNDFVYSVLMSRDAALPILRLSVSRCYIVILNFTVPVTVSPYGSTLWYHGVLNTFISMWIEWGVYKNYPLVF